MLLQSYSISTYQITCIKDSRLQHRMPLQGLQLKCGSSYKGASNGMSGWNQASITCLCDHMLFSARLLYKHSYLI